MTANNELRKYLDIDMEGIKKINEEVKALYRRVINGYYPKDKEEELKKEYIGELKERVTKTQYRLLATERAIIDKIINSFMLDKTKLPKYLAGRYSTMKEYIEKRSQEIEEILKNINGFNSPLMEECTTRYNLISNNLEKALFVSPNKLRRNIDRIDYVQTKCLHSITRINDKGRLISSYFWKQDRKNEEEQRKKYKENYPHDNIRPKDLIYQGKENLILGQTKKQKDKDERNERNQTRYNWDK